MKAATFVLVVVAAAAVKEGQGLPSAIAGGNASDSAGESDPTPPPTVEERVVAIAACYNASSCTECESRPGCR